MRFSSAVRLAVVLTLSVARASAADQAETHESLRRVYDPVVVSTALLRDVTERRTDGYRLYSARAGALVPVPFQFDQRDAAGDLVVLTGENAPGDLVFDGNDELVFMAKDGGDRIARSPLPKGSDSALEIEITDPVDGGRAWVYLLHFAAAPPPPSRERYVRFDVGRSRVETSAYSLQYQPQRSYFTGMRMTSAAGVQGVEILDRMKVRVDLTFSLLLGTWSPAFTEEDFAVEIVGVKNGPVRAIRKVRQWLDLGRFFPDMPGGTVYTLYYASMFSTPSRLRLPWMALKALRDFRFVGFDDFRSTAVGMTYRDAANPQGLVFSGDNDAAVNATQDHDWWVLSGPGGTCFHTFAIPEEWREWGVIRGTYFRDDNAAVDGEGREAELGAHAAGYSLLNMTKIRRAGEYEMNMAVVISPHPYRPGDEVEAVNVLEAPLTVRAGLLQ